MVVVAASGPAPVKVPDGATAMVADADIAAAPSMAPDKESEMLAEPTRAPAPSVVPERDNVAGVVPTRTPLPKTLPEVLTEIVNEPAAGIAPLIAAVGASVIADVAAIAPAP